MGDSVNRPGTKLLYEANTEIIKLLQYYYTSHTFIKAADTKQH